MMVTHFHSFWLAYFSSDMDETVWPPTYSATSDTVILFDSYRV